MSGVGYQSATDLAADLIRKRIHEIPLDPGSRINPSELAAEFRISRTPVRDALARLQTEGLVEIVPRVGIYVRRIEASEVLEIYTVREALEPIMSRWAAERASAVRRTDFAAGTAQLTALADAGDVAGYLDLVVARRLVLLEMSESTVLLNIFRSIDERVRALRARNLAQTTRIRASVKEHTGIAKAVAAGDGEAAFQRTQKHVRSAKASLMRLLVEQRQAS